MLKEYDVVRAKRKLSDKVLENSIGAVVMIFPEFSNGLYGRVYGKWGNFGCFDG